MAWDLTVFLTNRPGTIADLGEALAWIHRSDAGRRDVEPSGWLWGLDWVVAQ